MILSLVYLGDPRLREKAKPIEEITEEVKTLAQNMIETMRSKNGIGLAAPQVGILVRMFVIDLDAAEGKPTTENSPTQIYINPVITDHSKDIVEEAEGCLSIPGIFEGVIRPLKIKVEALDLEGNKFIEELEGWKARMIMHENDHLNGVLFIDRLEPKKRKALDPALRMLKKKYAI